VTATGPGAHIALWAWLAIGAGVSFFAFWHLKVDIAHHKRHWAVFVVCMAIWTVIGAVLGIVG
jgi:hypothetical protein